MILRTCMLAALLAAPSVALAQAQRAATPAPRAASPAPRAAAPVPTIERTQFIRDMDGEFDKVDADKNGFVTAQELEQFRQVTAQAAARNRNVALFRALDADANGALSPVEFLKLPMTLEAPPTPVNLASDSNRDQRLSKVENRAATLGNFDRMDTDKDGVITQAEMRAAGLIK